MGGGKPLYQTEVFVISLDIQHNLVEGSVIKKLAMFALPFLASNIIQSLYVVIDMLIIGNFSGAASMSGVNISGQITYILTSLVVGLSMGATVLIGQYVGAGDQESVRKVTATTLTILPLAAAALTALTLVFKESVLTLMQTPPESYIEADRFLTVTVSGLIFIFGYNAFSAILRGMGDSKHPFYFVMAACVINIILDLIFIAVFHMGAFGAALATVISQAISMFLCIGFMIMNKFHFDFRLSSFKIDWEQLRLIAKIGLPTSVSNSIVSFSFLFITVIVNIVGGVYASAAVGAAGKFNSFAFMPVTAVSVSITTMAAQSIGAGRMDRAVAVTRIGTGVSYVIMGLFFILVQVFPAQVIALFGREPEMIAYGVTYLRTFSFDFLLLPFIFCVNGLFTAGGHTFFTMISDLLSSILLRVPICWLFGVLLGWSMRGVGMGAPAASAGTVLIMLWFLASGRWKYNRV